MIDHVTLGSRDVQKAAEFYNKVLAALGYSCQFEEAPYAYGYGVDRPIFWVVDPLEKEKIPPAAPGTHVAFKAPDQESVDKFYNTALANGAECGGKPGVRPYHENYYAAFVYDLDGHKIEAVHGNAPFNIENI